MLCPICAFPLLRPPKEQPDKKLLYSCTNCACEIEVIIRITKPSPLSADKLRRNLSGAATTYDDEGRAVEIKQERRRTK